MITPRALSGISILALLFGTAAAAEPAKSATPASAGPAAPSRDDELLALRAELERFREKVAALESTSQVAGPGAQKPVVVPATVEAGAQKPAVVPASSSVTSDRRLGDRVDLLEVKQGDAVVAGDVPGAFRVPGTDVSVRLYGFAEMNWVHAFGPDNSDMDYSTFAPYLPLDGTAAAERTNRDYLTGRTSRIGVEAATPTRYGLLGMKLEGDFNNEPRTGGSEQTGSYRNVVTQQSTGSYGFRIRHAYGQFGGLLVGMTWSTFMDVDNYPETVDFNGPVGATFIRQPQIRFAYATRSAGTFTVALENSSSYVLDATGSSDPSAPDYNPNYGLPFSTSLSRMPDFVVRWDKGFEWGAVSARAMTQELRLDDGAGTRVARRGWGAAASASFKVRGVDFLALQVTGGDGIGRYLNYIEGAVYGSGMDEIQLERAVGAIAGYQLKATDRVRINLVYGITRNLENGYTRSVEAVGLDSGRFGVNRTVQQAHLGPIFTPMKGVDLGVEGIWARRETLAGERGEDVRLNFSAKYYIN